MRITSIDPALICEIPYLNAGKRPGDFRVDSLPVHLGFVDALPDGMSAMIATADLQGRETFDSSSDRRIRLLGEALPNLLSQEVIPGLQLGRGRIGVVLAGDFYTVPELDKRGGSGDVNRVWYAFANEFDWVVGVAGNHDLFGYAAKRPRFGRPIHFLDGDIVGVEGLQIAGLSGIPGNPQRPWRRTEDNYIDEVEQLLSASPDIIVTHDGPNVPSAGHRGSSSVRNAFEQAPPTLAVRGHAHWKEPLAELANGTQVLNVDARVVILAQA